MNSMLNTLAVSAFAAALTLATPARAMPNGDLGGRWSPRLHAMIKYANLTSEQSTQVQAILEKAAPQRKSLRHQEGAIREQIANKMLSAGTVNTADFTSLVQQDAQIHQQLVDLTLGVAVQIRTLLTPAQISHVAQVHQQVKSLDTQRRALLQENAQEEEGEGTP
jgi:Spy/CpxP family protein refolding chaperone